MHKNKHFSLSERTTIERCLGNSYSFKAIGRELNRDCTSISKEVKKHTLKKKTGAHRKAFNNCEFRLSCKKSYICDSVFCRNRYCRFCSKCCSICEDFKEEICSKLSKPPYVCNGCKSLKTCTLEKSLYQANTAQKEYEFLLKESRSGITIDETEAKRLDEFISPLIRKGQSINHICSNNLDTIMCSVKTIYNYVDASLFSARSIDLPRKVKFRPRKKHKKYFKVEKKCRVGRTYQDFLEYRQNNLDIPIVEMDTVEGVKGGKILLTIHFLESHFMLTFIRDANTSQSVIDVFEHLYSILGQDTFTKLFQVILTDNGSEFSNPSAIEFDEDGNRRTRIFYCNPSSPHQKGAVENNHTLLRRIIPKGTSLNSYTQADIDLMMNHVNSYGRKKLNNQPPHRLFSLMYGENILQKLNAILISPNDIILKPYLLKR